MFRNHTLTTGLVVMVVLSDLWCVPFRLLIFTTTTKNNLCHEITAKCFPLYVLCLYVYVIMKSSERARMIPSLLDDPTHLPPIIYWHSVIFAETQHRRMITHCDVARPKERIDSTWRHPRQRTMPSVRVYICCT